MMTTPRNDNAHDQVGEVGTAKNLNSKLTKKIDRVIAALKLPDGLNRFEAERIGEHCLNSTVSEIRRAINDGDKLVQQWETVPTRYCETGVRVLRYWLVEDADV